MQNIDIRFNATSNFAKVQTDLAAITSQAAMLGAELNRLGQAKPPALTNPSTWRAASNAVEAASAAFRDAASSSGKLLTQQIRQNSEAKNFNELLQKRDLTFGKMIKNQNIMRQAYQDQLRLQRMSATYWGTDKQGRSVIDVTMPKEVPAELDTWRNKMGFFSAAVRSGSQEMINLGKNTQWAGRQLMVGFTMPMAMFGAATGMLAYQQDEMVTKTAKVYDTMATTAMGVEMELAKLREDQINQAIDLADRYGSKLEDTYNVQQQLAAQGFRGKDLMGMTDEVQRISTLGDLDVDTAVNMTTALRTAFKDTIKDTKDLTEAFDYMNAVENATSLSINDIAEAVPRAGSALANLGVTVQQMTTLMVAMKEAGVDSKEGANALKSATTRILSVVPAAEAMFQGQLNGFESVQQIADKAGGNLYDFLKMLAEATNGMDNLQKQKGIAKLFGTYQYNRLNAALRGITDAMFGMGEVSSQTMKAIEIEAKSAAENAGTAADELARKQESLAGRFNSSWQKLRASLAQVGEPFLEIGIKILGWANKIAKWFANLDAGVQKAIAWSGIISGAAAVFIMFGGLMLNFIGQIGNAVGALGGFLTRFKILDEAMSANNAITEKLNETNGRAATQFSSLTEEIRAVASAYEQATLAAKLYMEANNFADPVSMANQAPQHGLIPTTSGAIIPGGTPNTYVDPMGWIADPVAPNSLIGASDVRFPADAPPARNQQPWQVYNKNGQVSYYTDAQGVKISKEQYRIQVGQLEVAKRMDDMLAARKVKEKQISDLQNEMALGAREYNELTKQTNSILQSNHDYLQTGYAGMIQDEIAAMEAAEQAAIQARANSRARLANGLMATGLGAGVLSQFVDGGLQTGLNTAATGLMVGQLGLQLKDAVDPGKNGVSKGLFTMSTRATQVAGKITGVFSKAFMGIRTMITGLMGPWGLVAAAAGFGIYKIYQKMQEGEKQQEEINKSAGAWSEALGLVEQKYKSINFELNAAGKNDKWMDEVDNLVNLVKDSATLTEVANELKEGIDNGDQVQQDAVLMSEYLKLTKQLNGTSKDAEQAITALYVNAGKSVSEATELAQDFINQMNGMTDVDFIAGSVNKAFQSALELDPDEFDEKLEGIAKNFKTSFDSLDTWAKRKKFILNLDVTMDKTIEEQFKNEMTPLFNDVLNANSLDLNDLLVGFDMAQGKDITEFYDATSEATKDLAETLDISADNASYLGQMLAAQGGTLYNILNGSQQYLDSLKAQYGITEDIHSMAELLETDQYRIAQINEANAVQEIGNLQKQWAEEDKNFNAVQRVLASKQRVAFLNKLMAKLQLPAIYDEYQSINFALRGNVFGTTMAAQAESKRRAEVEKTASVLESFDLAGNYRGAMQSVMGAVQESMLANVSDNQSAAMDGLQASQDAAMTGLENRLDAHSDALDAKADRIADHFDNMAERIEKSFDRRIEGINDTIEAEEKADEIRQRIYERSMDRINRLAESENRTIDFNVAIGEGNFDEAAKIFNEGMASDVTNTIEDQMDKAAERSERRRERLEKQIEALEKRKDERLEAVDKAREAAEKELEIEREKFDKIAQMRKDSLAEQQQADRDALAQRHEDYKEQLNRELEVIMAHIPRTKKEAIQYLNDMSKEYDTFGAAWASGQIGYTDIVTKEWKHQMAITANKLKTEVDWANAGFDAAQGMMRGMAASMGMGVPEFRKWLGLESKAQRPDPIPLPTRDNLLNKGLENEFPSRHGGGLIGSGGKGSRKGFAGSQSPHNETWINARKGEYVMQKSAVDRMGKNFMDRVNSGKEPLGGFGPQMAFGEMGAFGARMMIDAFSKGLGKNARKVARLARRKGRRGGGAAGGSWTTTGPGGASRPIMVAMTRGLHDTETAYPGIDFSAPTGTPVYAVGDGKITQSYDIPGYEPRAEHGGNGYRSYGRVMVLGLNSGGSVLYAHLGQRGLAAGAKVKGGSIIGKSGDTGYSTGPHLHFGASNRNPTAYLRSGAILKQDGALYAHKDEAVISASRTKALYEAIDQFNNIMYNPDAGRRTYKATEDKVLAAARNENIANNYNAVYNVEVKDIPQHIDKEELANLVVKKIEAKKTNVGRSRKVGGR